MNVIFITGGVRSGKSDYAEKVAQQLGKPVLYVATGIGKDAEMQDRIKKHILRRPSDWGVLEEPDSLMKMIPSFKEYPIVLLDCVSTWVANKLMSVDMLDKRDRTLTQNIIDEVKKWLIDIKSLEGTMIIVTNETGLGGVAMSPLGRWFQDVLGEVNQMIAKEATSAYAVISGLPMRIKG